MRLREMPSMTDAKILDVLKQSGKMRGRPTGPVSKV
jgi:hypothetical protein